MIMFLRKPNQKQTEDSEMGSETQSTSCHVERFAGRPQRFVRECVTKRFTYTITDPKGRSGWSSDGTGGIFSLWYLSWVKIIL